MCLSTVFPKTADQFTDHNGEKQDRKREKKRSLLRNKKLGKITFFWLWSKQYWAQMRERLATTLNIIVQILTFDKILLQLPRDCQQLVLYLFSCS